LIKRICEHWAFSNFNIATAALCYALSTYFVYEIKPLDVFLLILIFTATLSNYIFHRAFPVYYYKYKTHINNIFQWTISHLKFLTIVFCLSILMLGITLLTMQWTTQVSLIALAFITLLYSIPFIKTGTQQKRLRDIGYLKIGLIALTWALVCGNLPLLQAQESYKFAQHATVFFEKFLFIIAITIPFDIRDMDYDASINVKTLPIRLGIGKALIVAICCLLLSFIIVMYSAPYFYMQLAYAFTYIVSAAYILASAQVRNNFFYLFYVDGLMILLFICLCLTSIFV